MPNNLKPCPFCGGKAKIFMTMGKSGYGVECENNCIFFFGQFVTCKHAIEAWNRRAGEESNARTN